MERKNITYQVHHRWIQHRSGKRQFKIAQIDFKISVVTSKKPSLHLNIRHLTTLQFLWEQHFQLTLSVSPVPCLTCGTQKPLNQSFRMNELSSLRAGRDHGSRMTSVVPVCLELFPENRKPQNLWNPLVLGKLGLWSPYENSPGPISYPIFLFLLLQLMLVLIKPSNGQFDVPSTVPDILYTLSHFVFTMTPF